MSLNRVDAHNLLRWGLILGDEGERGYTEADKADAREQATLFYNLAADEKERHEIVVEVHEGYRQTQSVWPHHVEAFLADPSAPLPVR